MGNLLEDWAECLDYRGNWYSVITNLECV